MDAYLISSLTSKWSDWRIRHVVINMQWNEAVDAVTSLKTERNWTSNVQKLDIKCPVDLTQKSDCAADNSFISKMLLFLPEETQR